MMLLLVNKLTANPSYRASVPLALTRIKKKNTALCRAEKTELACEYINGNDNGNYSSRGSVVLCHLVLTQIVFSARRAGFFFL